MQLKFDLNNDIFNIRYIQRNMSWQTLNAKQCKALMRENPSVAMKILRLYLVQKFSTKMRKFGEKLPFGKMRTSEILLEFKSLFGLNLNANLTSLKNTNLTNFSSQNANLTKNSPKNPAKISSKNLAKNATGGGGDL